jgi:hypothetical protein
MVKVSNPVLLTSTFQAGWEACLFVEIGGARQVSDGRIDTASEILKNHGEITTAARPAKDWILSTWLVVDGARWERRSDSDVRNGGVPWHSGVARLALAGRCVVLPVGVRKGGKLRVGVYYAYRKDPLISVPNHNLTLTLKRHHRGRCAGRFLSTSV